MPEHIVFTIWSMTYSKIVRIFSERFFPDNFKAAFWISHSMASTFYKEVANDGGSLIFRSDHAKMFPFVILEIRGFANPMDKI